jgi:predicted ATPase
MKIEEISIKNYKTFRDVTLTNLPDFSVLVGANGSGKTTFFDVFGFLRDCLKDNVRAALQRRGGFNEVVSRERSTDDIVIELKIRMKLGEKERLVTYHVEISSKQNQPIIRREFLRYKRGRYGHPFYFLDFEEGHGFAIANEEEFASDENLERDNQTLGSPDILAIKGLGQFQRFQAANAFRNLIENWHVSDFHISAARGSKDAGYAEKLSSRGDNLPLVAQYIRENHPETFSNILEKMKQRVPGVEKIEAVDTPDGKILLRFKDDAFKDPFVDRYVSDGTIKMFAYLVLLYDPKPHPLLCIEEPENQLYPSLLPELAEEFQNYSERGGQVFVSTHSPDFLNYVPLNSIFWLRKVKGYTEINRASDDENLVGLVRAGDLPGTLWKQGLFQGADPA